MVLASAVRGFRQPLGGPPRRGAQQDLHALGPDDLQDAVDDGRLADPRPAGDHRDLAVDGPGHGLALGLRQAQSGLLFDPRYGSVGIDGSPAGFAGQPGDVLGDAALRAV